jgi:hypothetical protein
MSGKIETWGRLFVVVIIAWSLTACGGGGSHTSSALVPPGGGGAPTSGTTHASAPATLDVTFAPYTPVETSSTRRRPAFVSPATASIAVSVVSVDGSAPSGAIQAVFNTSPGSTNCAATGGTTSCSFTASIPVGNVDVLQVQSYDGPNGSGHLLGSATATTSIQANAQNVVELSLGGVIAALDVLLVHPQFPIAGGTSLLVAVPLDGSGAQIVNPGAYASPITLTSSDAHFQFITDGGAPSATATINSPNDQVVVTYDGHESAGTSATIAANAGGVTAATAVSVGTPPIAVNASGSSSPSLTFTTIGANSTLSVVGGAGAYSATSNAPSIATVSGGGSTFTVTATGYGSTAIVLRDGANAQLTVAVSVVPPPIGATIATQTNVTSPGALHYAFGSVSGALTLTLTGGTGTYAATMASTGTGSGSVAAITLAGATLHVTPVGPGTDFIIVTSGSVDALVQIDVGLQPLTLAPVATAFATTGTGSVTLDAPGGQAGLYLSGGNGVYGTPSGCAPYLTLSGSGSSYTLASTGTAGTCTLSVTDSAGTTGSITVTTAATLALNPSGTISVPNGGSQTVAISGGIGAYTATATNGLTVSVSGSTLTINGNHSGTATVTVKDALGDSATLTASVPSVLSIAVVTTSGHANASGTTLTLAQNAAGKITPTGTAPYTISNNGAPACSELTVSQTGSPPYFAISETTANPTAGSCVETITDATNATKTATVTIVSVLSIGTPSGDGAMTGTPIAGLLSVSANATGNSFVIPIVGGTGSYTVNPQSNEPNTSIIANSYFATSNLVLTTTTTAGQTAIIVNDALGQALTIILTTI